MERQGLPLPGSGTRVCLHRCTPGRRGGGLSGQARSLAPASAGCPELPAPLEHRLPHLTPAAQLWAWRDTSPSFSETLGISPQDPLPQRRAPATQRPPKELRLAGGCSPSPPRAQATPDDTRLTRLLKSRLHYTCWELQPGNAEASRPSRPALICALPEVCPKRRKSAQVGSGSAGKEPQASSTHAAATEHGASGASASSRAPATGLLAIKGSF